MHILASVGEPASHTWQDQAVLGHLPQAAGFGLLLNVCSVYSTAPVHPVAGICLLPRPQGLILSRVGRRRKEAIKCKTCPEMGHTYAARVPPHFGTVVQPGELLGCLPMRSLPTHTRSSGTREEPGPQRNKPPKARNPQSLPHKLQPNWV